MDRIIKTSSPLSYGQEAMWFIYQIAPESVAYNIFITAKINSYLNITTVNRVWEKIIELHPILKTKYTNYNGKPVQEINQQHSFAIEVTDASNWSEDYLKEKIFTITDRPFNLEKDPVLRVNLFTLSEKEHILLLTMHHIAGDMWSFDLLLSEFQALYTNEIEQVSQQQKETADYLSGNKSYLEFIRWQSEMLSGSKGEKLWQYWQQQLAGELPILNLLTDKPRPALKTYQGAAHILKLDEQLIQKLKHLALASGTSLYQILLAAFYVLLYRYTNQTDILVGSPMRGRGGGKFKNTVGYFVNLMVLRTSVQENATFKEFLAQISKTVREAQKHQDYPFSLLAEQLQPQRDPSRSPLCQVSFTWQVQGWCEPTENSLHSQEQVLQMEPYFDVGAGQRGADFDLSLLVKEAKGIFQLSWQYNTDLFEATTITRMALHFVALLEGIVANPQEQIWQLPLLTEVEQQQLLVEWNDTGVDYPQDKCIHQFFEEQVERTPDAVAVVFENEQLTYQQLNCRANQLAHYLKSLGVGADVLVGLCVERSLEMVVGLLGILKAGGAYVPLDPEYPEDRLRFMLEDAQVLVLLTQQQLLEKLPQHQGQVVCLDTDWQFISQSSQDNAIALVQATNLAYVIYTSGSTGKPKGVTISHGAIANHCCIIQQTYELVQSDRILQFASINFDASLEQIFPTLLAGATLVLRGSDVWTPTNFQKIISDFGLTVVNLPTAYWQQLAQESAKTKILDDANSQLRLVIVGGDVMLPEYVALWQQSLMSGVRLLNAYGPTEATITATLFEIPFQFSKDTNLKKVPIGCPLANKTVYILDKHLQPVPIGVPGELHIGGATLAQGYLNRPELTQEKFIPNPFEEAAVRLCSPDRGSRLYKTGDLARYLPNGNIEYLGRIDNQVKIRGFRIELGEIETVLSQYPYIQASCVIAREDIPGNKSLVAYIVSQKEQTLTVSDLRSFLKEKLPEYMVPSAIVILEALPFTPSGKVDRRALPAPDLHSQLSDKYVAPRSPNEELLAQIWAHVLKVEQVGINDNFFELGGHSLLATQLVSRIRNIFKVELALRELFAAPTVAQLAHLIGQLQQQILRLRSVQNSEQFAPPILPRAENAELALSYAQQRLWFLDQFEPDSPFYNMPLALHLAGTLNVAALEQSLQEIIFRHEALRTNFITVDGEPTQIIQTESSWTVSIVDLEHLSTTEREIATQQLAQQEAIQPFDLANQALVRATLVVQSETEHVLLLCMHHIVSDGWSMGVFIQELVALYNAYSQDQTSPLTPLPIQYADFALWQRQWLQGEVLQSQLTYWQQQLASAPALLSLPTDRPRPAVQTYNGTHQYFALSEELTTKLTKLSQEQGVTLFMTLLAAYDTLIYRYTGTEDILVGSPIANRDRSEIEGLIGFFVNTLVMRTDVSGNPSFSELLGRVRDMAMQAYSHQNLPFEMLVEALQPERDLSYTPLFQVMFVLQNAPMSQLELTGLTVRELPIKGITSRFDLTLIMQNAANGMVGLWEYNTDLFDSSTIERMTSHFVTLLESIIANPEQQISQLPLLSEVEQQQLLVDWNDTQADYPLHKCIHQLFEEEVERTPNAVAVEFENQQLTYHELNYRANQLAHHLRSLGVAADVLVGLCVERSLEMVIGLLGILKAGAAYVPLDPEYPAERLSFILEDTQASVLLTQQSLIDRLPPNQAKLVCLDTDAGLISQCSQDNLISGVQAHNLLYIIYTSGSTGQPKGIAMTQLALCNHILWHGENLKIARGAKTLQFASISFDVSFQEIFTTWCSGGTLFLIGEELRQDASALLDFLQEKAVERMFLAFVGLQQLAEVAVSSELVNTHLREIITSGEQLQITPAISQWFSKLTDCTLHNQYGPSESHLATSFILNNSVETWPLLPYIGRPIANTQIYILDKFLQPVPIGVPGELYISGVLLAEGYFNRTELTREKFIPNPFSDEPDSRLYKTGDLGRYLPDGNIESLGRIDNQVKIRGFRIELGEIEAVLSQLGDVQASCAVVREDIPGNKYLAAYVVPQKEQTLTVSVVRSFLKEKLPEYMVPSAIVILEALPLTPNGKLDRRALPAPDLHSQLLDKYVAPRNPIEEILSLIWAQVLKVELVGIHDNFFELGGHSLLATQLISRVRTSLKVELPLRSLFAAPTVAQLSEHIQRSQQQDLELTAPPILPRPKNTELPLSYAQQRLWFLDQLNPNSGFYNLLIALRLAGTLNVATLEQSLQEILHRHEALRTNFVIVDGKPSQVIQTQTNWTVSVVDLQHLPTSEQKIASQQLAQQQAIQPFELATQLLVRVTLVVLNETEHLLLVCMHHIVSDGWSMGVFVQELAALYNAYSHDKPTPLEPLPIQYADFALWQRQWFQGDVLQSQLSYWQKQLKDAPALLSLPTDRPRPSVQTFAGAYQHFALSEELTTKLTQLSQQQGCTLFMTLLAAYDTLLYRYTGVADILIGSPIANRNRGEIEGLIGFFVNTLVMRTDLSGNPSFSELLTRVREMALGAYAHQDLPFEMLVEALQPQRNLSHTPLFQVMFVLQNVPMSQVDLTGLTVNPLLVESATAKFDLTLAMENTANGLVGVLEYNTDLFDSSTLARMADHFVTLLEAIVANPQERISQLPMLTAVEQQQLLIDWNDTWVDYASDKCIHQLFEEQVERTPDTVAVVFENEQLTYYELNSRANQLAYYLRSLGVRANELVGICVERSLEMVVGLLGILKAGGAYLPLDPEYPTERLHFILRDAQVQVLLTQHSLIEKLPANQATQVFLDTDAQAISLSSQENLITASKASNLAYVIYTSGSTGQPKGVLVNHHALLNLVFWHQRTFEITALDKATQVASTAFDAAVWELWPYLTAGASIYLVKPGIIASPLDLQDWLQRQNITISFLPTPVAEQLLSLEWRENTALRTLLTGGDKLHRYPSSLLPFQVVNNYGPTENTVVTTSGIVVCDRSDHNISPSIGRPIANTQIYILDEYLQAVPVGVPGELHIGGASLAQGYLNRSELTQQKFIPNPFEDAAVRLLSAPLKASRSPDGGSKLYKTGDLGRYLPDGNIEYLGRIDNQVKIRGFRIELGEIEALLNQNSDVQASCVIAREDIPTEKRLVAYVAPHQHSTFAINELRHYLKAKLPPYMMPQAFVMLEAMPLTPNGKVDRRALPAPDLHHELKDKYVAPRTPVEELLAQIWATVLKVERVGIYDNFFELGGHSLLATQLVSRIRSNFQVELPLRELFATATVAELAQSIQELQQQKLQLTAPPILPRSRDAELPLSYSQTRLWFLDQFDPNSAFYNIPIALRLVGSLKVAALEQSLQEIIARHEALRTNFITVDGKPSQIIQTETNWTVSVVDWKHLSPTEQEIASQQLAQQQAIQPFELATQALVRATLVVLSETEHILLMCMHHIVSDGWSMGVFVQELAALYSAYSQGQTSPLAPLPIQYADFAIWQRQWLQGDILQKQLSYWEKQLADAPALLSLPTDRPRPAVQTFAGATQQFELSIELTSKLTRLSQEQGVTLFMTLLAAFDTLLYRYTEQEDILVGTPIANRNRGEIEGLIGFFVNTLVLRTDLSGNPSFSELLTRVRQMAMEAYSHQDLPFEMLVETLQPERDLSHAPLFQVDFLLQNDPLSEVELTGLNVTSLPIESATAKFDLTLAMAIAPTGMVGVWEYNTDLFDASTIARMAGHFVTLLEAIVENPQQQISQLPMLTAVEQQQLFVEWNDTQADYPQDLCIHQLFEKQCLSTPDAIAVIFENQQLTYQQLNTQANQLANYLQSLGVGPEVLVGIYLERSLSVIVGLLAVLKAGGGYVPLDPDYPQQRLADISEDSQFSVLITEQKLLNSLPIQGVKVIVLDTSGVLKNQSQENPVSEVEPENLACILYTSGSTGKPKGVMLAHEALVNHSSAISEVFGLTNCDRVLQFASFSFDVAAEEIFPTWYKGATVVLRPAQMFPDFASLAQFIEQQKLSVLNITPAYWHEWAVAVSKEDATVPQSLRLVAVGGDAVLPETVTMWQQLVGDRVNCLNVYGPTEASVTAIVHDLLHPKSEKTNSVLIGRPIANTQAYILDRHLQPVPIGVKGELHIGGVRLARGYLNLKELTDEKFIPNPFEDSAALASPRASAGGRRQKAEGRRLYKTGDLARYLPDGNIECFGRIDNQVKIRGFRIELGEIEAVLNQHSHVQTSCVIIRDDAIGDKRLVAYVVPYHEQIPTISELRQFLSNHLPLYMVPNTFVVLESLPLTPNRKVDRRALPIPDLYSELKDKYVAPRTPNEEMLAQIWAQVLKVEQVGIHDNFFEIGGHSLLATQLVSRIRNIFKVELPLRGLFAAATVAQLVHLIGELQQQNLEIIVPPILPRAENAELSLSYAQQRLWFLDQLQPNSALYNIPIALRLAGTLNVVALEESLREIIHRHEALRTNFVTVDGKAFQVIQTQTNWTVSIVDLQHLLTSEQKIASQQLAQQQAIQPFDLTSASLLRATLVVLNETEHLLLVCMHHIVSDEWSMGVFVQELAALYNAYSQGQTSPLEPLPIQYADFALWQRQWLQGDVLQSQLSYWQQQLKDAPALLSLPTDRPRPAVQTFAGAYQEFALSEELTGKLTQLSQQQGMTLFMTLLAAFDTLLYRYTGQSDILVGTPIANRNRSEVEGLIGFFVNTLVMRTDLSGNPSFSELLTRVREMALGAYAHQDLPFEMLVEALQPERNLSHTPLFQVAFVFQNAPVSQVELTGLTISDLPTENITAKFDLTLAIGNTAAGFAGVLEYNTDLFDSSTIERMAGHFVTLLEAIVVNPQLPISQLPLLTAVEQQQLLIDWNDTGVDYPSDKCIHQLLEEQAKHTPDAVAVVFEEKQLTYAQLNSRANQLAHYLQTLGVKADALVGICVERSLEMVVGLLGILKAGGAYLPLDPEYPTERLHFILRDAQVQVLLTQHSLIEKLPANQATQVFLDTDAQAISLSSQENLITASKASNLAYVIYTSGSTGQPKGVLVTHHALLNLVFWHQRTFEITALDKATQVASTAFDAAVWELWPYLTAGASIYLVKPGIIASPLDLQDWLQRQNITISFLPTPVAEQLLSLEWRENTALRILLTGGDKLHRYPSSLLPFQVVNNYGPTENTVVTTSGIVVCDGGDHNISPSIGRPIANTQIYILDEYLQPVPVGVPGELHIGGASLAQGYLNRSELTQEKFIPNPFSDEPHSRLYKTGDLARYLSDGNIEFLGRIDNQVKIRGFRIELGEIEAAISQLPEVREAVVVAREDQSNNKRLVAYVVPQQEKLKTSKKPENLSANKVELWPSIAEYYVYDDLLYYAMTNDHRRNDSYKIAINQLVKDKIVVEIGTGKDAILSRFCVQGGAKKIYAIERNEETCRQARACIEKLGLADKITVIHGDATLVDIPELADVCVSEIVGAIGGSEGAAVIINNARKFLKPDGLMIPERSVTKMAAVTLPDEILHNPHFAEIPAYYTKKIFEQVGYQFDLRVCIRNFPQANVLSTVDVLEDLNFNESISPELSHEVKLEIQKNGRMDGFLVWLNLHTIVGEEIDILEHEYCWLPVYFPLFQPGIKVEYGDVIQAVCSRTLCSNNLNPDYAIKGYLLKKNGDVINFEYVSYHYKNNFRQTPFYQRLFADSANLKNNHSDNLAQSLRANLKKLLPSYMIPSSFVLLDNLPLTPNGKIDHRALPTHELTLLNEADYVMPNTEAEKIIAGIWQKALQVEKVGIHDNFFDLGGHSLIATQVISRLQEAFGTSLPLRYIFESPTIAQLSEAILAQLETGSGLAVPAIAPVSRDADIPLSWAQERLWFVNQLEGESGAYTIDFTLRLVGNLNVKALEKAFAEIVQRHEVLRTHFEIRNNQPVQVIDPNMTITLPVVDLQNLPERWKQVEQLATAEACKPFDLANGPVLRVKMWQVATDEYVLLFAIHHIAADGWSMGVLISELSAYYRAFSTGSSVELPKLPIQYADFAVWQRQWFTNQVLERQLNYWKQQLTGAPPLLELPTDRPRPAIQTFRGGTEQLKLDALLTQQLKKLSQESGSTLFMTLLAGFVVLLSRYSGQTDLVVGSPIANRNRTEIEGLIGFFVNSLALRFDLSQEPTFEALLAQVRTVTQNAYDHQDLPFEMLVEELQLERNLDRNPLTQVVFALQNAPTSPWDLPDLKVEGMPSGLDSVRLDLEVYLWDAPEGLGGFCSYNRDLFDAATITRMMQHFKTLLAAIVDNPHQPVSLLPLLTQQERHQLLVEWNDTQANYPQNQCIHQLFESQVERTPDAVAVVFENQQLTYHELNCRANQLAQYLRSLGVGADVLVGLCVERSLLMAIGLLAILKAGGAYVPLDPEYPTERLSFMLEDAQVWVLLTQQHLSDKLPKNKANTVFLDEIWSEIAQNSQENFSNGVTASHLANVIYTSGSTGKPKGVMVEHSGLCNLAQAQIQTFGVDSDSRVLQFASFSFDACISEILMSWASGATLYLGTKDSLMPGTPLIERLRDRGITHVTLPPSALAVLPTEKLPALQTIIVAGEACSAELIKQWSTGRNFFNAYGPTEASVCATIAKCTPLDEKVTIGRSIANKQIYILDSHLQPVPIGVAGELHIAGVGLARGYLNRLQLTQEKFIPNPLSDEPDSRLYKTGDLARYLADGNIEYLGRIDNQVKVRGFRIELGDIEAVLSQHPLVQEGVVVAIDNTGDKQLAAYLVPALKNQVLPQQLAQWQSEYVTDWQTLYEQAYGQPQVSTDDPTFNISGWNSSYTKEAIPALEMQEWVESTVDRILSLSPQRVLEIGCGTGLLLSRVAPNCLEYWGCDYSSAAIQHVEQICKTVSGLDNVRLLHQMADNFTLIPKGEFDTVVINSVVQYFPSVEYLLQVLEGAIATIGQKGTLFVGDVRSLPLLEPYHAAVQLSRSPEDRTVEQWQQQVHSSVAAEEELVIDPRFFIALQTRFPQITWVEIVPKRGNSQNELTQFRYDVTLHISTNVQAKVVPWLNWQLDKLSLAQIQNQLHKEQPELLGIRGVPNQRVQQALQIWQWLENSPSVETVGQMRQLLAKQPEVGINPEEFYQLGQYLGYTVHLSWWGSSQDGAFDVVLCRNQEQKAIAFWDNSTITTKPWTDYTNNPLYGKLVQKLVPQVREFIQQKLPNYMVPQAFVLLNALPLTPNGKVDRRALPAPDTATRNLATGFVSPRTPIEAQLVQIWSEVLGTERIGINDNFFELGGHSLLATQVISRLRNIFSVELSLQNFLEYPTVANLAQIIEVVSIAQDGQLSITKMQEDYEEGEL
ncbi:non-ribosomal peptide synthase/polyketide synthase [Nostoc sp.]|uniref:non-ribosomal peptide synthase/polyketide synthase n=1 Tax=Nostoc sp. TaxID=1180 RepID=UPI002FF80AA8